MLRACASALKGLHEREPQRRCGHLVEWAEQEAERLEQMEEANRGMVVTSLEQTPEPEDEE